MAVYYNEIDPFAAQWLRNLIAAGRIAPGEVDERSIVEIDHRDLRGFDQCHFFAGIGVWSHALRRAGWADARPVWTGSCPCQPFSAAGAGKEFADERHLWPAWFELIRLCRPVAVFGEQVASRDALAWLDHVCADLEGEAYAVGAVDTCAAGYGAPHIRQRLYWVADAECDGGRADESRRGSEGRAIDERDRAVSRLADAECGAAERQRCDVGAAPRETESETHERERLWDDVGHGIDARAVADAENADGRPGERREEAGTRANGERRRGLAGDRALGDLADTARRGLGVERHAALARDSGHAYGCQQSRGILGDADNTRPQGWERMPERAGERAIGAPSMASATNGFWSDAEWLSCRDGKARPTEPGTFPLVAGASSRVGRLRAYGNSIVAPQAAEFIRTFMSVSAQSA